MKKVVAVLVAVLALYPVVWWSECNARKALLLGSLVRTTATHGDALLAIDGPCREPANEVSFTDNPLTGADFWTARLTAIKIMGQELWQMIWPTHLSSDYSYPQIPLAHGALSDWIAWFSVVLAAIGMIVAYRRSRPAFYFALIGLLAFLPSSNLFYPIGTIRAERFLLLAGFRLGSLSPLLSFTKQLHGPATLDWRRSCYPPSRPLSWCVPGSATSIGETILRWQMQP